MTRSADPHSSEATRRGATATPRSRVIGFALAWLLAFAVIVTFAFQLLERTSNRLLQRDAERTALNYAQLIIAVVPDLHLLFETAAAAPDTLLELRRMRRIGDVFEFKLFDRHGQQLLQSQDLDLPDPLAASRGRAMDDQNARAKRVVHGGVNYVELKQGTGLPRQPKMYSEAFVPMTADGSAQGVVAVYVDQTDRAARIRQSFLEVALIVAGLLMLVFSLAAVQTWRRTADRRHSEARMRYLAEHDRLSGALNRSSFNEALQQAAQQHRDDGTGFAVLCIDLDRFKQVNDALGHAAGDEVVRQTTDRLRSLVRGGDRVARLGGDEFAVLQIGVDQLEEVSRLAQRVVDALAAPYDVAGQRVLCGASVGAVRYGFDATTIESLLHKADVAMYRAKSEGRGRYSYYDPLIDHRLESQRALAIDLRRALPDGAMALHYQPLYAADGHSLLGYEALMRWRHPQRGVLSPVDFITLAESSGQIEALGEWALRQACADAATWPKALRVAVNLSAAQFHGEKDLVKTVCEALAAAPLAAHRLELEITESLLLGDTEPVTRALAQLSAMGIKIAMDDFGTGYSSLAYLWRFPIHKIKIDRAFTQGLGSDDKVGVVVRAIVSLAHSLDIRVNAEGIETEAQLAALQSLGCDELQGFLLGWPQPADGLRHVDLYAAPAVAAP